MYGVGCTVIALLLCGCEGTTFRSSVPRARVDISVNLKSAPFVPLYENPGAYLTVTEKGYYVNGKYVQAAAERDYWGFGGVVLCVNAWGNYDAYDLTCPNCYGTMGVFSRCETDGTSATCSHCGEEYNLFDGTAFPRNGSKEALLRLTVLHSGDVLYIRQ